MPCRLKYGRNGESSENGSVILRNPHIAEMSEDVLYHLSLGSGSHDLQEMFGDVKFVCMGGTPRRMESFAHYIRNELNIKLPTGADLYDISRYSYRYSMFKIGPVLTISHGMGIPSLSILLHEVIKLLYHAKCKDVIFIRIGTCGGIGIPGGSLVISESAVDGMLRPYLELHILGKPVQRPAVLDKELAKELKSLSEEHLPHYKSVIGKTMCTYDFYEGQGRLDGAFCDYTENDKLSYLKNIYEKGICNIEMESLAFAAMCNHAGIRGAVVCVTLLDRLKGDQVSTPKATLEEWQHRPQELVAVFIKKHLGLL
ncbi:uridine phosphorylase 2-like isoform X2 [Centruroides sculpturatus]|uniref:uridine phosphorylase 2-like isoform X2 n=1 Tax=Centruroides sculpturatus TaxID=218467 RepID=UPI000C6EC9E5|nr:uridine phosphorylase 2-like isoform X2 [Centruroides sculpturatus]